MYGYAMPERFACEPAGEEWHRDDLINTPCSNSAACLHHEAKYAEVAC